MQGETGTGTSCSVRREPGTSVQGETGAGSAADVFLVVFSVVRDGDGCVEVITTPVISGVVSG